MPSRTINIGPSDGSQQPFLAIHGPGARSSDTEPWAALSHRWGSPHPLSTITSNLNGFSSGTPMGLLPRTFRDAIHATRRLGIRHIWIDSLCIPQDSKEDWAQEAQQMAQVYRNALVNICPNAARNCDVGFLSINREPINMNYAPIWNTFISGDPEGEHRGGRLQDRSWLLQEVILSPRTLHFNSNQIMWECCQKVYLECRTEKILTMSDYKEYFFSSDTPSDCSSMKRFLIDPHSSILVTEEDRQWYRETIYHRWYQIVFEFLLRRLSYE